MAGASGREERDAQAKVLRAVLIANDKGVTEEDLAAQIEDLTAAEIESAVEALVASNLLKREEARLYASGPATRFNRLRPL